MTTSAFDEQAAFWGGAVEDAVAARLGRNIKEARIWLQKHYGVTPGTLDSLRRGRIKDVSARIYFSLREAYISEQKRQLKALQHEIAITEALVGPDDPVVVAVATALAAALAAAKKLK